MKLNLNKKLKIGIIISLVILIGVISFNLYKTVKYPDVKEQTTSVYTYNNNATVKYKVYIKPNKLYDTNPLDEGMSYITAFVDYINVNFHYKFTGERDAGLEGQYSLIAKVRGYTGEGEKMVNIWEKDFPIVENKSFVFRGSEKSIREDVKIDLERYNTFVKEIIESSRINCETSLTVFMDISIKGETHKGTIEETLTPSVVIPLNTNMFQISGNTEINKPGAIVETTQVQLPVDKKEVLLYVITLGVLLLGLVYMVFFTKSVIITKDPVEKMLKQIFKKHGDRLVALNSDLKDENRTYKVKSIDDLVRIADEICKPIMYKYSDDYKSIDKFYIIDNDEIYILDINETLGEDKSKVESKVESYCKV